jgi:nitrite reductase/ring-hydroxylating ferredoxin subunit
MAIREHGDQVCTRRIVQLARARDSLRGRHSSMTSPVTQSASSAIRLVEASCVHVSLPRRVSLPDGDTCLVVRRHEGFAVIPMTCPHKAESMEYAIVMGDTVTCPSHGYVFQLSTGQCSMRRCSPLPIVQAEVVDGWVSIDPADVSRLRDEPTLA